MALLAVASLAPLASPWVVDATFPGDDPLITLTFAKNLARGRGFVFNHGPPVLGTTTPAFAAAVAAVTAVGGVAPTTAALWLSVLGWIALVWVFLAFRAAFGLNVWQAASIGWLVSAQGWIEHLSMEATSFALVLVVAAAMVFSRRWLWAGLSIALLFFIRGEGVLFGLIAGVVVLAAERTRTEGQRSPTVLFSLGASIPVLLWSAYALPTFGAILPATLDAKMVQVASGLWAPFPVRLLHEWLPGWGVGGFGRISTVLGYGLVFVGVASAVRVYRRLLVFPVWAAVYATGYAVLGVPGYSWYRLPVFFGLAVMAGLGLERTIVGIRGEGRSRRRTVGACALAAAVLAGVAHGAIRSLQHPPRDTRAETYRALTRWLNDHADPGQSVAFFEVGALGYDTDLGVVDLVGLVTPSVLPHVLRRDFASGFWELQPEWFVDLQGSEFTRPILEHPMFGRCYEAVATFGHEQGRPLTLYRSKINSVDP